MSLFPCYVRSIIPAYGPSIATAPFHTLGQLESYLCWDYPEWQQMQNRRGRSWRSLPPARSCESQVWCSDQVGNTLQTNRQTSREPMFSAQTVTSMEVLTYFRQVCGRKGKLIEFLCPHNKICFEQLHGTPLIDAVEKAADNHLLRIHGNEIRVNPLFQN